MLEILAEPFMIRALVAGVLLSALAGTFGVFVVQRKLSFLGAGLGHAAFGGIALGLLIGVQPLWIAIPFTLLVAFGIAWIKDHTRLAADTAIGVFFSVSVALGILFLSLATTRNADAFSYLFGSLLSVTSADLWVSGGMALTALLILPHFWGDWAYATFDEEAARVSGLNPRRQDMLLIASLAAIIVVSLKVVGILLVAAWIVVPAAAARLLASTFGGMTRFSVTLAVGSTVIGLLGSVALDVPTGAMIVLVQAAVFGAAMAAARTE
ncbi:MAG: metal ABC transporter permease [Bacteroidota bacterium]|nr:metal ABC transporter permease [Bacteroidota bacterium]